MTPLFDDVKNLDELVHQVRNELGCMAVLVHGLTESEQTIHAMAWNDAPRDFPMSIPIGYSICQHTAETGAVLAVDDAFAHPLTQRHHITVVLGIAAYLGVTIGIEGGIRRTICAVERRRRMWDDQDRVLLSRAAALVRLTNL